MSFRFLTVTAMISMVVPLWANRPETGGFRPELPLEESDFSVRIVPLRQGKARPFRLGAPAGRYHLMVKVKSSDRSGNEGDSMFGGYTYWMPRNAYRFRLDGKPLQPEISARMVRAIGRDKEENGIYTGWLYFPESVQVTPDSVLSVECAKPGGFITQIALLNEAQWRAEKLRMSNRFGTAPGKGFGNAWGASIERPKRFYPVDSLQYFLRGLERFSRYGEFGLDVAGFQQDGKTLADQVAAFVRQKRVTLPKVVATGDKLAGEWEAFRSRLFTAFAEKLVPAAVRNCTAIDQLIAGTNPNCHAGREARFYAGVARRYFHTVQEELKDNSGGELQDFAPLTRIITNMDNGMRYLAKAREFAAKPQRTMEFPEFFVERDSALSAAEPNGVQPLLLNGIWQFSPGKADVLPKRWTPVPIPNDSPFVFYNMANVSDEVFGKQAGAYWRAASIQDAWFKTSFTIPVEWSGAKLALRFDEVMMYAEVFVNGRYAGSHHGGFIPFEIDVTKLAVPGKLNHLLVFVSSAKKVSMGPESSAMRYHKLRAHYLYPVPEMHAYALRISGDVNLLAKPLLRSEEHYVQTSLKQKKIIVRTTVVNDTAEEMEARLSAEVLDGSASVATLPEQKVTLAPGERKRVETEVAFPNPKLWGIGGDYGDPHNRYLLKSVVAAGERSSTEFTPFAFREMTIEGRKMFLNGKEFRLQGSSPSLTERVTVRNNRYAELFLNRARREGHINFLRYHRFNLQNWPVTACDDAGIVSEGEGPWWELFAPTDINGESNYDDPVWLENCFEYYTKIMRKFRNSPSMLFFSLENETMTAANSRTVKKFRERAQAEAPHMILMNHSHSSALAPEAPVAVLHDYDLGVNRIREYCSLAEKPVVIGEFWNPEVSNALYNPQQARGAERLMKLWLERLVKSYYDAGVDGVMPYTFTGLGAIASKRDSGACGPWSEFYTAMPQTVFSVPVVWPSMSGSGGIRAEKLYLDNMTLRRGPVNFFDPERPAYTPTAVMEAYRNIFQPLPELQIRRSPELLVEVVRDGKPVPRGNVFSKGESSGRQGIQSDAQGRAWFCYDLPGRQTITVTAGGRTLTHVVDLVCTPLGKPGWDYLPKLRFDLGAGTAEFTPGKVDAAGTVEKSAPKKSVLPPLRREKSAFAGLAPVGPSGFIRRWLVLGPFPNYGSRKNRTAQWMNTDFLGGEATILPSLDLPPQQVEFKRNPEAYWEPGRFSIRWDWLTSDKDVVDLTGAFLLDRPGLDGIIQFIFGYAACYVKSDSDREAVLTIGSDDGYKLFLNGEMVGTLQTYRGCKPDENRHPVRLKKGWNRLLVKIEQETGGYAFALRFLDSDGRPLLLETSLTPPVAGTELRRGAFLRDWMVIGPFPNVGGRPKCAGFQRDFLGGEADAVPGGGEVRTEFPAYEKAYYEAGTLVNRWKPYRAAKDAVDLGSALLRSDVPGLDVSPLQYVAGYAAATVEVPEAGEYTLELSTFNGVRGWLNGKLVIDDHNHTFNRDPNSPVLAPSHRKTLRQRVSLLRGVNRLLVKLDVDYGPMDFTLKLE